MLSLWPTKMFTATLLRRSCQLDNASEAVYQSQAANIVREDILRKKCLPFGGSFTGDCQEHSVPQSSLAYAHYHDHVWNKH